MDNWGVYSEVGQLHTVLLHQPGWEHRRMTPWDKEALLFDDIIDMDFARPEHKAFAQMLRNLGIEVLFFADLLKDVCAEPEGHRALVEEVVSKEVLGTIDPMDIMPTQLIIGYPSEYRFGENILLDPLPNLYFMRDPAFMITDHLIISHPHFKVRHREALLARGVYTRHPYFENIKIYDGILEDPDATIEGGDVLVVDEKTVLVGISERTNEAGADHLAKYLFENTTIERVMKIFIPKKHEFMHLDTIMTFVDRQQIITMPLFWDRPDLYARIASHVKRQVEMHGAHYTGPDPESLAVGSHMVVLNKDGSKERFGNVIAGLGAKDVILPEATITVAGHRSHYASPEEHVLEAIREQWNDAANTFAIKPGTVTSYERNGATRRSMEQMMVEVMPFPGGELVRGRGGPRCMTMPLKRDGIHC